VLNMISTIRNFRSSALALATLLVITFPLAASAQGGMNKIAELPLVAMGPAVYSDSKLTVNGQTIIRDGQTTIAAEDGARPSRIRQGDYIAVTGDIMESGISLATTILVLNEEYVDGASPTYLRAIIDDVSDSGIARSANSQVDFTPSLSQTDLTNISSGNVVEFVGFNANDLMVATTTVSLGTTPAMNDGRLGSSVTAIRGSGVRAIRGSGVRAIRGSGVRAIRGSGVRAIRGSGVRAIRGSGVRAIRGSGVRAIRGSGVRAIRGSGVRAIRGSGVRAIRGSGVR
jgi:hypothetical protein